MKFLKYVRLGIYFIFLKLITLYYNENKYVLIKKSFFSEIFRKNMSEDWTNYKLTNTMAPHNPKVYALN